MTVVAVNFNAVVLLLLFRCFITPLMWLSNNVVFHHSSLEGTAVAQW